MSKARKTVAAEVQYAPPPMPSDKELFEQCVSLMRKNCQVAMRVTADPARLVRLREILFRLKTFDEVGEFSPVSMS